jgi:ornithine decarboxylase
MTFDNTDELYKIKEHAPDSRLVLRILADDSKSLMKFGVKFGADLVTVESLLKLATTLELSVVGVSFHVGSGCYAASAFSDGISMHF